jgi:hypothetical protein
MIHLLREIVRPVGALAEALQQMQRAAGRGVDGMVSRLFHPGSRALGNEVDFMDNAPVPPPEPDITCPPGKLDPASPAEGPDLNAASGDDGGTDDDAASCRPAVQRQLEKAAVVMLYSQEDPDNPDVTVPSASDPAVPVGVDLARDLCRFDVLMKPSLVPAGVWSATRVGQVVGTLQGRFRLAPEDFAVAPGREPPPTALDPTHPQRFVLLDGRFAFNDQPQSSVTAYASGTTLPVIESGAAQLRLSGVLFVTGGCGRLQGLPGTGTLTGLLMPPDRVRCVAVLRFLDLAGTLLYSSRLSPVQYDENADPSVVYLTFRGEPDPDNPRMLITNKGGGWRGAHMSELLRLTYVAFDLGAERSGLRTRTVVVPIVGKVTHTTLFHTPDADGLPTAFSMQNIVFTFFDEQQNALGTLQVPRVEGIVAARTLSGNPAPAFQIAGCGAVSAGTGPLSGDGTVMINAALTLTPDAFSTLYVLRIIDTEGRLRDTTTTPSP